MWIKKHETDGDWRIELTENEDDTPVKASCIIVEIPSPSDGAIYGQARGELAAFVDTTGLGQTGDVNPPVQVTFIGAAFFDGYHQKKGVNGGPPKASQHGRCNSSVRNATRRSSSASDLFCSSMSVQVPNHWMIFPSEPRRGMDRARNQR